jgi:hypothetical protein
MAAPRVVFEYEFPVSLGLAFKTIGLVELTVNEEKQAHALGGSQPLSLMGELCKWSIYEVDGVRVSRADDRVDEVWEQLGPKGRNLLLQAYNEMSNPGDAVTDAFRSSRKARTA